MDPIGFALESFDPVGAWRTTDEAGAPIETDATLANGERIDGVAGLRDALLRRSHVFVQTFTEKLLVYGLGRGLTANDLPAVRRIVRAAGAQGNRFSAIVLGIVGSDPFQMRLSSTVDGARGGVRESAPLAAATAR